MNRQYGFGFTLIELMVTLAVAGVLAAIGAPVFVTLFNSNRIATVTNDYVSAVNFARSEAIKGGATTTLCMSIDGATCAVVSTATPTLNWASGWIVWSDRNGNNSLDTGEVLASHGAINAGNVAIGGIQTSFSFTGTGALVVGTLGDTFNICTPTDLPVSNTITIEPSGHVRRVSNPTLAACP